MISLTAISMPFLADVPYDALLPVNSKFAPILIVSLDSPEPPLQPVSMTAIDATAMAASTHLFNVLIVIRYPS